MEGISISRAQYEFIWQDREIRFDSKPYFLACRKGEFVIGSSVLFFFAVAFSVSVFSSLLFPFCLSVCIDSINSVEDTKGNNGERGSLIVTNLRIMWIAHASNNINLSIGLSSVLSANIKQAKSKLRGHTQALCVLAKYNTRFEFIFTSLVKNSPRLFTTIQAVLR
jgi:Bardet-Biedl syndrome 5 protein